MWVLYFYLPHNSIQLKGIRNLLDCIAFALAHDTLCMSWISAVYFHQRMHLFILVLRQKNIGCSSVTSWEVLTKFSDKTSSKYEKSSKRRCGAGGSLLLGSYGTRKSNKLNRFWIFFFITVVLLELPDTSAVECHCWEWDKAGHRCNSAEAERRVVKEQ